MAHEHNRILLESLCIALAAALVIPAALGLPSTGIIPDTFVDEADVVVEGARRPDGVFEATTLLAKCPSKYESAQAGSPIAQGGR